jgi:hypothetical protein
MLWFFSVHVDAAGMTGVIVLVVVVGCLWGLGFCFVALQYEIRDHASFVPVGL